MPEQPTEKPLTWQGVIDEIETRLAALRAQRQTDDVVARIIALESWKKKVEEKRDGRKMPETHGGMISDFLDWLFGED